MSPLILALLVFIGVSGLIGGIALVLTKGLSPQTRAIDRLNTVVGYGGRADDTSADLMIRNALQEVRSGNLLERLTPDFLRVSKMFEQADVSIKPSALFGIALGLALVGALLSAAFANIYVAPVGAAMLGVLPFGWLWFKRASRLKAFAGQLPEAMELTARALRAGHALSSGLHTVSNEMPNPIAKEFKRVYEEQNYGVAIEEALFNMCERVPNLDLKFFVTSVAIQRQTGGDLAEILDRIGYVIRERFKILGQVKALTAEGRLSGIVLIAMPIGLFIMMLFMKPDYISLLWTDPMGVQMSVGAIVLMLIGSYAIKKIIDIKV
ncbi:MAG: type II secretion system F family protein [Zavarzinella sp.]